MKNKDFEKLYNNVKPVLPSNELKRKVLDQTNKIPFVENKPLNQFFIGVKRFSFAITVLVITLIASLTTLGFYNESYYELYIDINPSIELRVNRFGVVNEVKCLNEDAQKCVDGVDIKGLSYEEAVSKIVGALNQNGYFVDQSELFVSGYSNKSSISQVVESICYRLSDWTEEMGVDVQVLKGDFTEEDRNLAQEQNLSPYKYSLINELLALDDSYTREELAEYKMSEINELCNSIKSGLSEKVILDAEKNNLSPIRYQLILSLEELDVTFEIDGMSTKELKDLYRQELEKYVNDVANRFEEFLKDLDQEKATVITSILIKDPTLDIEELKEKTLIELKAIDFMLSKQDVLLDLFK